MKVINSILRHCKFNKGLRKLVVRYVINLSIFLCISIILILLNIYPHRPIDLLGWIILIVGGILISLYLEWIGEFLFNEKIGLKISNKKFSSKRIIFSLFIFGCIIGALFSLWFSLRFFIRQHFE